MAYDRPCLRLEGGQAQAGRYVRVGRPDAAGWRGQAGRQRMQRMYAAPSLVRLSAAERSCD